MLYLKETQINYNSCVLLSKWGWLFLHFGCRQLFCNVYFAFLVSVKSALVTFLVNCVHYKRLRTTYHVIFNPNLKCDQLINSRNNWNLTNSNVERIGGLMKAHQKPQFDMDLVFLIYTHSTLILSEERQREKTVTISTQLAP